MSGQKPDSFGQWLLIGLGVVFAIVLLVLPLALIFTMALGDGLAAMWSNLTEDYMLHAIGLTVLAAVVAVPVNILFGIMLAWCITHYEFKGKKLLQALVNIPYATSPVVAGFCYLILFGRESALGQWLSANDIQVVFAWPAIISVTLFVTSPYVARILIPLIRAQGLDEEVTALTLGANGWQIFTKVTLPNIKWGLLYGAVLSNARAVGEYGAVAVVSGTIMNQTLTLPLLVDQLNNDYKVAAAFTAASVLALMALITLVLKILMEWLQKRKEARHIQPVPGRG